MRVDTCQPCQTGRRQVDRALRVDVGPDTHASGAADVLENIVLRVRAVDARDQIGVRGERGEQTADAAERCGAAGKAGEQKDAAAACDGV